MTPASAWNHTISPQNMVPLPRATVSTRRRSIAAGAPATRSGATRRLGSPVTPARVHSSSSGGHSAAVWLASSICSRLATFTPNSPVSAMLRAVSSSRPRRWLLVTWIIGGFDVIRLKFECGARLRCPSGGQAGHPCDGPRHGGNGVYLYGGSSALPTDSYNTTNY